MKKGKQTPRCGLARALSKLGYCSRSQAEELIRAGRVQLNGTARRDPETPVRLARDRVEVDGRRATAPARIYLMLNKLRGVVTTISDEKGRETVYACLPGGLPWAAPIGRLDKASEGLLLFTNDSNWAARLLAPESHVSKTYHVQVAALPGEDLLQSLMCGVRTKEGEILRAESARVLRHGERNTWLEIILDEGKNRQIRRMLEHFGIEVLRLIRVAIGPLQLGMLAKGSTRHLSREEKLSLDRVMPSIWSQASRRGSRTG
jgi:23S rRNA pseudouridine2605 synthase